MAGFIIGYGMGILTSLIGFIVWYVIRAEKKVNGA
jgi:hypothetical protein